MFGADERFGYTRHTVPVRFDKRFRLWFTIDMNTTHTPYADEITVQRRRFAAKYIGIAEEGIAHAERWVAFYAAEGNTAEVARWEGFVAKYTEIREANVARLLR